MKKLLLMAFTIIMLFSCKNKQILSNRSMIFKANGEEFIRKGFIDKNNWHLTFTDVFVNLTNINAVSESGKKIELHGNFWINLLDGSDDLIEIAKVTNVNPGNYKDLQFSVSPQNNKCPNCSMLIKGTATKDNKKVKFTIKINESILWDAPDGYVGKTIKGIVTNKKDGEEEISFHFDHLFGDVTASKDDHVNTNSVGFDYFMQYEKNNSIDISQDALIKDKEYEKLIKAIWSLGHSGEGHAKIIKTSTTFNN